MEDHLNAQGFPRQFARTRRFSLGVPQRFTVSPDGARVLFVRSTGGTDPVSRLWLYEAGEERILADPPTLGGSTEEEIPEAEKVRRERAREMSSGVVAYATDREARVVAFALGGELWVVRTDGGEPHRIAPAGPVVDPRPAPDGASIAYVTGGALHVVRTDGTDDRLLAAPEGPEVTYGLSDHVSAESIGRSRGYWWSPDSDALLVARVDNSPVQRRYIADPANPTKPPRSMPYPAAGTANAKVSLHIVRPEGERVGVKIPAAANEHHFPAAWTDPAFEYVTTAGWDSHGPLISVQTRDQRSEYILTVDPGTGATELQHHARDHIWLSLLPGTPVRLPSGTPVIPWCRDDTQGLRIGSTPTPAGLQVREVLGAVGERVFFTAGEEPTETHVWSYDSAAGFVRVSAGPGVHTAAVGGDTVVLSSRTDDGQSVTVLHDGVPAGQIAVLAEEPRIVPCPVFLTLGERQLRSQLYLPSWYEPGSGKLPVLLNPYSGHGIQLVVRARGWWTAVSQWFAEQGFAVLVTDGRGTPGRGREWEKSVYGDRLTPVLEDQIDALREAAAHHSELNLDAVAIRGWSYGGYLAAGAVLRHPEVFHAAIAGGAPTDRRLYDTHWEERFLGHPDVTPETYERCSLVAHAHKLTRPLLLVHGIADDNVTVAHMLRFSSALLAAGRPHSVLPLSGATHMVTQEDTASNLLSLEVDFLKKSLRI
ncbi:prolyl oligopeptidase family serine peptidase [Streptomyces sp. NPDC048479]|uniref:S9 family peptidase n=1 Tax=Streptomyces sp. NPDC048479 TaxID=3154725 RepID=UPI003432A418